MHHLDAHGTGIVRLLDGELVRVIREAVVEAPKAIDPREPDDGIYAICELGDFGEDGWFGNASVIAICGR